MRTIGAAIKVGLLFLAAGVGWKIAGGLFGAADDPNAALRAALEAEQLANQIARAQAYRTVGIIGIYAGGLVIIFILSAVGITACTWLVRSSQESRPTNGLYPVRTYRTPWLLQLLGRPHQIITINPNNQVAVTAAATIGPAGEIAGSGSTGGASWDMTERTARDMNRAQIAAAMPGGRMYAATGKYLAGAYDRPEKSVARPSHVEDQPQTWTVERALQANGPDRLAMGQGDEGLLFWRPSIQPHLRYHGATQQAGKTTGAAMLALGALQAGWSVAVIDRRRGKDWGVLAPWVQLIDARDPDLFVDVLSALRELHHERDRILGERGAPNIDALPPADRPQRLLVILEEYGNHRRLARVAGRDREADQILAELTSEAGAGGIHLVLIDQTPQEWDQTVKANVGAVLTGPLPQHSGQAAGYYWAHDLKPFTFAFAGQVYRNFDAMAPALEICTRKNTPRPAPLIDVRAVRQAETPPGTPQTPPPDEGTNANEQRKWAHFARAWIESGGASISALARAMAHADGQPPDPADPRGWPVGWQNYKSIAHMEWHHEDSRPAHEAAERRSAIRKLQQDLGIDRTEARRIYLAEKHRS